MDNFREARILLDTVPLGCYPAVDEANILEQSKSSGDEKGRGMKDVGRMSRLKTSLPVSAPSTRLHEDQVARIAEATVRTAVEIGKLLA